MQTAVSMAHMTLRRRTPPLLTVVEAGGTMMSDADAARDNATTPEPLVAAAVADAHGARERLFEVYAPAVHAAISRYLALRARGRLDLADDLTHEVFLALLRDDGRRLRHFEGRNGCSFTGWLRVVAVRLTIDMLRRERRLVSLDDDGPAMTDLRRALRSEGGDPELGVQGHETATR